MAKLWDDRISNRTISRASKKVGSCSKKRPMGFPERDEAKRQAFLAELSALSPDKIVYLVESPNG
ncbi:hypothetical protein [Microcoleus sp. F4-D5]|uniref:hypothetical protein n=1 Tax=Microcoleus sp. F4-D5 TaxID=2818760 RepID=UPI002FD5EB66